MKTGTAIALAIGVPAVVGLVIWGITANRIIDKIDDVKPGGGAGGCSDIRLSQAVMQRTVARMPQIVANGGFTAASPYMALARAIFRDAVPSCSWDNGMVATVTDNTGRSFEWQDMVARAGNRSIAEVANDPEFQAWLGPLMGSDSSAGFGALLYAGQQAVA